MSETISDNINVSKKNITEKTGVWYLASQILKDNKIENTGINQYHLFLWIKDYNKGFIQEDSIKENSILKLPSTKEDIYKICRTKLKMNENNEQSLDNDFCLEFSFNDIIYHTSRTKINDECGNEAADLKINDLDNELVITPDEEYKTFPQAVIEKGLGIKSYDKKRTKNIIMSFESFESKTSEELFKAFRDGVKRYTKNGLNNEVNLLISKFQLNNNIFSEFKNNNIQKAACSHEKTKHVIEKIIEQINRGIKYFKGDIYQYKLKLEEQEKEIGKYYNNKLEIDKILKETKEYSLWKELHWTFSGKDYYIDYTPAFDSDDDFKSGLQIAINDVWGYEITISNYKLYRNKFQYNLLVTFYDHFGLDSHDVKKFGATDETFKIWYYLQHAKRFDGRYKPFITTWNYEQEKIEVVL